MKMEYLKTALNERSKRQQHLSTGLFMKRAESYLTQIPSHPPCLN